MPIQAAIPRSDGALVVAPQPRHQRQADAADAAGENGMREWPLRPDDAVAYGREHGDATELRKLFTPVNFSMTIATAIGTSTSARMVAICWMSSRVWQNTRNSSRCPRPRRGRASAAAKVASGSGWSDHGGDHPDAPGDHQNVETVDAATNPLAPDDQPHQPGDDQQTNDGERDTTPKWSA